MGIKSIWISTYIDEEKLRVIAEKQKKSVSKLISNLLKENYDIAKEKR